MKQLYLILHDQTFFIYRYPQSFIDNMRKDWVSFVTLGREARAAIVDALLESRDFRSVMWLRYIDIPMDQYLVKKVAPSERDGESSEQS
ncbi:MAG: hypothetical protein JNJ88_18280 [Planctomycetes bacterium]|nr:hypothetical protein [Planctomycetota bacterium]